MECKSSGFTLLEILIAILILAFMAAMTGFSIQRSIKIRAKIEKEIEDDSQLREVVALITKDINLAFHWTDPIEIVKKQIGAEYTSQGKPNPFLPLNSQGQPIPAGPSNLIPLEKLTAFVGDGSSLYLTSLGHERIILDSKESDQMKVGYFLKNLRSLKDKKLSQTLIRRVSPLLDGEVTNGGKETSLIDNVKIFKLRYLSEDAKEITDQSWVDSWKSEDSGDEKIKGKFPAAVELELVTEREGRTSRIKTVIALHSPNNKPFSFDEGMPAAPLPPNGTSTPQPPANPGVR